MRCYDGAMCTGFAALTETQQKTKLQQAETAVHHALGVCITLEIKPIKAYTDEEYRALTHKDELNDLFDTLTDACADVIKVSPRYLSHALQIDQADVDGLLESGVDTPTLKAALRAYIGDWSACLTAIHSPSLPPSLYRLKGGAPLFNERA